MRAFWQTTREIVEVIVIALVTVFIIRTFLVQPFLVSGASMDPTLEDGNYLLIDELTYRFREPERGEIIVFKYPKDRSIFYIKRIIGAPGDIVVIGGGKVSVNGISIKEEYLSDPYTGGSASVKLKNDEYFVMGDNRAHSFDSRNWGPVKKSDIVGITRLRILPLNELTVLQYR